VRFAMDKMTISVLWADAAGRSTPLYICKVVLRRKLIGSFSKQLVSADESFECVCKRG